MTQKAVPEWDGDIRKHLCEEAVALSKTHTRYSSKERFNELYLVWFFLMQQLLRYFWGCLELLLFLLKIKCTDFHQRTDSQRQSPFAAVVLRNHSVAAESLPPWLYEIIQSQQKETRLIINHLCVFSLMHRKTDIQQEPSNTMDEENKNIFYCCCPAAC